MIEDENSLSVSYLGNQNKAEVSWNGLARIWELMKDVSIVFNFVEQIGDMDSIEFYIDIYQSDADPLNIGT